MLIMLMAGSSVSVATDLEVSDVLCTSLAGAFFVLIFFSSHILPSVFLVLSCWLGKLTVILGVSVLPSVSCVHALR